jgi:hypothetical protein
VRVVLVLSLVGDGVGCSGEDGRDRHGCAWSAYKEDTFTVFTRQLVHFFGGSSGDRLGQHQRGLVLAIRNDPSEALVVGQGPTSLGRRLLLGELCGEEPSILQVAVRLQGQRKVFGRVLGGHLHQRRLAL